MTRRTGTWFQAARGRAMVRTRAMRDARHWKRVAAMDADRMRYALLRERRKNSMISVADYYRFNESQLRHMVMTKLTWAVARARDANRAWRRYRQWDADDRALEVY